MMRTLSFLCALLFALQPIKLNSCGWDWNAEEYRFWLLQPELAGSRPLHAFYFTTEVLYGPDYDEITQLPYAANIAEWKVLVGADVPDDAITHVLYGMDLVEYDGLQGVLLKSDPFVKRLAAMEGGWPEYMHFAKRCEQLVNAEDPWGFIAHDGDGIRKAWVDGQCQLKAAKHPLLKARLAFQMVRLAHYAHDPERPDLDAQAFYDKHLAPLRGRSWMEPTAAFYLANMLGYPARDLAFADIFDRATDKQFRMVQLFISGEIENNLQLAGSDQQRANLLVMRDLQHPGRALEDLERIATFDPGNRHLPLLLAREVNKLEDWLFTPTLTEFNAAVRQWQESEEGVSQQDVLRTDMAYLHQVKSFIQRIVPQADADQRALLILLDGHLSFVIGDFEACRTIMARVEEDPTASSSIRVQARLDRTLCGIMATDRLTDATRNDVLALVELVNTQPELFAHRSTILGQLHLYLGKKMIERGEVADGILILARTERMFGTMLPVWYSSNARHVAFKIAEPVDYDRMIALLDKKDKTPFERYLTATDERPADWEATENHFKSDDLTRDKLLDYKAMWYLREDQLEEAAATYRQVHPDYWTNYDLNMFAEDDPFLVNIDDPHNYDKTDSTHYTRLSIVERMVALKKEAARNPKKRALNNYLLGNAYFNMTWHGKYWGLSRIGWSMNETSEWREEYNTPGDDDYYGCSRAQEHYETTFETAKDPVLKAMACRMLGECESNWRNYSAESGNHDWWNPWVEQLTDERSLEAFARIEDCSGYADFVRRFR